MIANILSRNLSSENFKNNRSFFYILVLIIGACFTDSPSGKEQAMIAIPLMLAFEWAILLMDKFKN
jgi:Sec-independent protein secretion pathway component TatC